ncbi:MAG: hypothetical protein AAF649_10145 [Verrucomicrobiota bacterium]
MSEPAGTTTINLSDIADRYLDVYQRLFDIVGFIIMSNRKITEEDYDQFRDQFPIMPKTEARKSFEETKELSQNWVARNILSEALSTIVPLLEDSRTVLALCDYKAANKPNEAAVKKITGADRSEFMAMEIPAKLEHLKSKYEIDSELTEHVLTLITLTKAMVMRDGILTKDEAPDGTLNLKIRSITLTQAPVAPPEGGQPILGLTRQMSDNEREIKVGDKIVLTKAETVGSLITVAGFLATLLQGVQQYAKKVGAADDSTATK